MMIIKMMKKDFEKIAAELSSIVNEKEVKEMESDGGIDLEELEEIFSRSGLKLRTQVVERFNELDANKNGKLEQSEVKSDGEGEDYMLSFFLGFIRAIAFW